MSREGVTVHSGFTKLHQKSSGYIPVKRDHERQCPTCAEQLYHTQVYAAPWLLCCPIHKQEFTDTCPACGNAWPAKDEIHRRKCHVCGPVSIDVLHSEIYPVIRSESYQSVIDLYEYIGSYSSDRYYNFINIEEQEDNKLNSWCSPITFGSEYWPALHRHKNHNIPETLTTPGIVKWKQVRLKKSLIVKSTYDWDATEQEKHIKRRQNLENQQMAHPGNDFILYRAMRRIIEWIKIHTVKSHRVHIHNYSGMDYQNLDDAPDVCPYCLAISMWFMQSAGHIYDELMTKRITNFRFCKDMGYYERCAARRPNSWTTGLGEYAYFRHSSSLNSIVQFNTERSFSDWYYEHGLKVVFNKYFRFCVELFDSQAGHKGQEYDLVFPANTYDLNSDDDDQKCFHEIRNGELYFYYTDEEPLDRLAPIKIPRLHNTCRQFDRYISERLNLYEPFDHCVTDSFEYGDFITLFSRFREFFFDTEIFSKYIEVRNGVKAHLPAPYSIPVPPHEQILNNPAATLLDD